MRALRLRAGTKQLPSFKHEDWKRSNTRKCAKQIGSDKKMDQCSVEFIYRMLHVAQ